ncbi:MAG TPA: hypothetical protein VNS32_01480 [Flavisolibacter sp.]|nr:hypothetical protein [Flavisolibacter sp.]
MKIAFTLLLLIGGLTSFAQNTVDGNWKGTRETPNGTFEVNYSFKVQGNELTGTWKTQFGEAKVENGKIDYTGEVVNDNELSIKNERGEMKLSRVKS